MSTRKVVGLVLLASPLVAVFVAAVATAGWWVALFSFGVVAAVVAVAYVGARLLVGGIS